MVTQMGNAAVSAGTYCQENTGSPHWQEDTEKRGIIFAPVGVAIDSNHF